MSVWDDCAPYLAEAVEKSPGVWTLADVEAEIRSGRAHLWQGPDCAVVTEPLKAMNVWLAGGDLNGVRELMASGEAFARALGCDLMTVQAARKGWTRALAPLGFAPRSMLVKEL